MDFKHLFRRFPVTSFLIGLMLLIFLLIFLSVLPKQTVIFVPGELGIRTFIWSFVHIDTTHLVFNLIAALQMGTILEHHFGSKRLSIVTFFVWLLVSLFAWWWIEYPLVGFSGILMGWVTYGMLGLWSQPQMRQALGIWLGLNIIVGFLPGVSFLGHLLGAVAGFIVFMGFQLFRSLSKTV